MIRNVFHFSFTVGNVSRSVTWYVDKIGLELVHRQRQDNSYTKRLVGVDDAILEIAQLKIPSVQSTDSTHMLELVEYVSPRQHDEVRPSVYRTGGAHLAFIVDSIDSEYTRLIDEGVLFVNPPVLITEGANRGGKACYLYDPDGITLELIERPE